MTGRDGGRDSESGDLRRGGITAFTVDDHIGEGPGVEGGDTMSAFYGTTEQEATLMEPEKFSRRRRLPIKEYMAVPWSDMKPEAHRTISEYLSRWRGFEPTVTVRHSNILQNVRMSKYRTSRFVFVQARVVPSKTLG